MANFFDKLNDATLNNPKAVFEKDCIELTCRSLEDLDQTVTVMGKILDDNTIQFSGIIMVLTKNMKGRTFFTSEDGKCFEIEKDSIEIKLEEIQQKTKTSNYETSVAKFNNRTLSLN